MMSQTNVQEERKDLMLMKKFYQAKYKLLLNWIFSNIYYYQKLLKIGNYK